MPVAPNQTIQVTVERPAAGGRMIGRLDGQIVLVGGAIPGERVTARVERTTRGAVFADTTSVLEPSSDRRAAFSDPTCGGCAYSHIAYARQLALKSQVITDAFARIGRIVLPTTVAVAASPEEGYRMRARLHVREGRVGFFREGTHQVCDARHTRQLLPATCDAVERVMAAVRSLGEGTVRGIELSENIDANERVVHLDTLYLLERRTVDALTSVDGLTPGPYVRDALRVGGRAVGLRRHVRSFFQGNRFLLHDLVAHVVNRIQPGSAVADLYAGVGLFTMAVVARGASIVAVEGDRFAAEDLKANALAANGSIVTRRGDVESVVNELVASGGSAAKFDTVIVDPPRTGMSSEALGAVLRLESPRIIYVSCDVATLARDSRKIVDAGYVVDRVDAFDLFPNTPHVETVVELRS